MRKKDKINMTNAESLGAVYIYIYISNKIRKLKYAIKSNCKT